jgi:hypothetical protein
MALQRTRRPRIRSGRSRRSRRSLGSPLNARPLGNPMSRCVFLAAILMSAHTVVAQVMSIDFEEVPPSVSTIPVVVSKGFSFSNPVGIYVASGPSYCFPECPGGSGHYIIAQGSFPSGPVTLQRENGEAFTLAAFDFAETNVGTEFPAEIRVDGLTTAGDSVSFEVVLDGINDGSGPLTDFQRAALPPTFQNLHAVTFTGITVTGSSRFNYSLDNIQVLSGLSAPGIPTLNRMPLLIFAVLLAGAAGVILRLGVP